MNYIGLVADILEAILKFVIAMVPKLSNNLVISELDKVIKALQAIG